jgi:hypothetical protein
MKDKLGSLDKERQEIYSYALSQNRGENIHQLTSFGEQVCADDFQLSDLSCVQKAKPTSRFLGFFPTGLDSKQEVLSAHRLVGFDVIRSHRSRRSDQLPSIFVVAGRLRKPFHKVSALLGEKECSLLQVVRPLWFCFLPFLHSSHSSSDCFEFRDSNFGFSLP